MQHHRFAVSALTMASAAAPQGCYGWQYGNRGCGCSRERQGRGGYGGYGGRGYGGMMMRCGERQGGGFGECGRRLHGQGGSGDCDDPPYGQNGGNMRGRGQGFGRQETGHGEGFGECRRLQQQQRQGQGQGGCGRGQAARGQGGFGGQGGGRMMMMMMMMRGGRGQGGGFGDGYQFQRQGDDSAGLRGHATRGVGGFDEGADGRGQAHQAGSHRETIQNLLDSAEANLIQRSRTTNDDGVIVTETTSDDAQTARWLVEHVRQMKEIAENGGRVRQWDPLFQQMFDRIDEMEMNEEDIGNGVKVWLKGLTKCGKSLTQLHAEVVDQFVARGRNAARQVHEVSNDCCPDGGVQQLA